MEHGIVKTILVVGRDVTYAKALATALRAYNYNIVEALDSSFTLDKIERANIDLILIEANCGQAETLALLDSTLGSNLLIPVACYADFATQEHILRFQERGVAEFFLKPLCLDNFLEKITRLLAKSKETSHADHSLVACHPQSQAVLQAARRIASEDAPLLISGETGVGKKTLARYIHQFSSQSNHPINIIYCGMGTDQLEGYSQQSNLITNDVKTSGIILLDEVIEMTSHLQKRLLMLLREWEMGGNGGGKNWRLISLTRDPSMLLHRVKNGEFLADLYYRISVYSLDITPLRERVEDILPLAEHFIQQRFADWKVTDRVSGKSGSLNDYTVWGLQLGVVYDF